MNTGIMEAIDNLVHSIYTVEQTRIVECFMILLDELDRYIKALNEKGISVDISHPLMMLQDAFLRKDYTMLADILLGQIRPVCESYTS